jgi:hypothetical protein
MTAPLLCMLSWYNLGSYKNSCSNSLLICDSLGPQGRVEARQSRFTRLLLGRRGQRTNVDGTASPLASEKDNRRGTIGI